MIIITATPPTAPPATAPTFWPLAELFTVLLGDAVGLVDGVVFWPSKDEQIGTIFFAGAIPPTTAGAKENLSVS